MLAAAGRSCQQSMPRLDALNEAFIIWRWAKRDAVAGGDNVTLVGRQRSQQPPHAAAILLAIFRLDNALDSVDAQHPAGQTSRDIDGGLISGFVACLFVAG